MAKATKQVEQVEEVNEVVAPVEKPVKAAKVNHEAVKAVLAKYPHVHTVHINEKGEWHFMPTPGFTAYSREDILNG